MLSTVLSLFIKLTTLEKECVEKNYLPFTINIHVLDIVIMYLCVSFKVRSRFLSQINKSNKTLLITDYKNV